jgi:folate-binding protein YgfZ
LFSGTVCRIQCLSLAALNFQFYFAAQEPIQNLWSYCQKNKQVLSSAYFDYQVIQQGVFFITPTCSELFTPQEINFELIKGISFTKGCYTGQEVVARLHYRGIPKRRGYLAEIKKQSELNVEITSSNEIRDGENKAQGHLLQILSIENRHFALISLSIQSYEGFIKTPDTQGLHIGEGNTFLSIIPPHYPLSL